MAFPKYFKNFPNVDYALGLNKAGKKASVKIKDYFHLMSIKDMSFRDTTLFYEYSVQNGQRPEVVAYEEYGNESFYWVILQVNGIVDFYSEWPLSIYELDKYVTKKYGSDDVLYGTHHYETVETKDSTGSVVLPAGIEVSEDYVFEYPTEPGSTLYLTSYPHEVTNYEYERRLNDKKSEIVLIDRRYVLQFVDEYIEYAKALSLEGSAMDIADYYK